MGKWRNNALVDNHFRKDWQTRVKTWFNQPARKQRRRQARIAKASRIFPRPVAGPLRPVVHPQGIRYNFKVRLGRGFTLDELKEAGVNRQQALSIGIAVDHRRKNHSERSLRANVQRLKEYKSKLVLFPRNNKKPKAGEATPEQQSKVEQQTGVLIPIRQATNSVETVSVKDLDPKSSAVTTLRVARTDARMIGIREVRKKKKAEEALLASSKKSSD